MTVVVVMAARNLPSWMAQVDKINPKSDQEKLSTLPFLTFPGRITYSYNKGECNFICEDIIKQSKEEKMVVGFDIEWKVTYKTGDYRKTSVMQLCVSGRNCYIFQLVHMQGFPSELRRLLEDENISKVGVGIKGDVDRLKVDYGVSVDGVIDLADMANKIIGNYENWSLNGLLMNRLRFQISKSESVRCSDWEVVPLSEAQIKYAVLDAYAGSILYEKLLKETSS